MNNSKTFKAAHKLAKDWMPAVKDYPIAFSLALAHVYKTFTSHHVIKVAGGFDGARIRRDEDGSKCFSMFRNLFSASAYINAGDIVELVSNGEHRTVRIMMTVIDDCEATFYI